MPAQPRVIRVFISSPIDVRPERLLAEQVIRRLDREFASHFRVEAVLWERQPLTADAHFQDLIVPPRETDIVVVLLWSRIGQALPTDRFRGPLSGRPVSGTEWEFEDALKAKRELGRPDLLLYRKTARVEGWLDDEREVARRLEQRLLLRRFLERWIGDAEQGSFRAAFWDFADAAALEAMLEQHLRALLRRQIAAPSAEGVPRPANWHRGSPYRGLLAFEVEHAPVFFGRRRARNELRELLARQAARGLAFVLVVGASGSGKSSLVKAGLLPDLLLPGMMPRVALCRYAITRPGDALADAQGDPLAGLAAALCGAGALTELAELRYTPERLAELMRRAPDQVALAIEQGLDRAGAAARLTELGQARLALVIDQLEELFTSEAITAEARKRYVAVLGALARCGLVWVIATLRSDFFDRVETLPALASLSGGEARYLLTPPDAAEIGQIIRQPAQEAGLRFEVEASDGKGLDEVIQAAVSNDAGALPLLQYLLEQLWQARGPGGVLTYDAYRRLGGLEGAIGRRAEALLAEVPELVRGAFPALLRALVTIGGGGDAAATARQVTLARFPAGTPARLLIDALLRPAARILVVEGEGEAARLRVAHEALLTHWPRAAAQIAVDRRDLQIRGRLEEAAARWRAAAPSERDSLLLARGVPLSEAEALLARRRDELEPELIAYVEASGLAARSAERRRLRRLQLVAAALGLLAVLAGGGAVLGWLGQQAAQRQEQIARARESEARTRLTEAQMTQSRFLAERSRDALAAGDAEKAQLLALAGLPGEPGEPDRPVVTEAVAALAQATLADRHRAVLSGHRAVVLGLGFAPDGARLVSVSMGDRQVRSWDTRDGTPLWTFDGQAQRTAQIALSPDSGILSEIATDGTLRLWDVHAGQTLATVDREFGAATAITLNRKGDRLASGWKDGRVRLHDARNGAVLATLDGEAAVRWLEFSNDGGRLAIGVGDRQVRLWQPGDGVAVATIESSVAVKGAYFSADGERLATGASDGAIRLWDAQTGAPVAELGGHGEGIPSFAFNADGSRLASAARDGTVRLWNGRDGALVTAFEKAGTFAFSRDGQRLATAAPDGPVRLLDANDGASVAELTVRGGGVRTLTFSPDGRLLAVLASDTGRIGLWDWRRGELTAELPAEAKFASLSFSPDGARLATVGTDRTVHLWEARRDLVLSAYTKESGSDHTIAFDPDRHRVMLMSGTDSARLIDLRDGSERAFTAPGQRLWAAALSPDGARAVTGSQGGTVRLWDVTSGKALAENRGHQARVMKIGFNADGSRFVTRSFDGTARLWESRNGNPLAAFAETDAPLREVVFDIAGARVATAARNGMVRVWDAQSGAAMANFSASPTAVFALAFSPDGGRLTAGGEDGQVRVWDPRAGTLVGEWRGPDKAVRWLGFNRDGSRLAALGDNGLRLSDAAGSVVADLKDPSGRISTAAFTPDGTKLATSGSDGTVRLWDARDGAALAQLRGHSQSVWGMAFGSDGALATVSLDTTVRQWDLGPLLLSPAELIAHRRIAALRDLSPAERDEAFLTAPAAGAAADASDAERQAQLAAQASTPERALLHHALAARLYAAQHKDAEAATQRQRQGTLARSLTPAQAARVWRQVEAWRPGDHSSD